MPDSSGSSPCLGDDALARRARARRRSRGNEPWPLADEDRCWAIVEGAVDVFVVSVGDGRRDGGPAPRGAGRARPAALPAARSPGGAGRRGGHAPRRPVRHRRHRHADPRARCRELLDDPVERLLMTLALSDWAETLSVALPRERDGRSRRPPPHPGRPQTLAPGEALVARGGAACVRVIAGTAHLVSDPDDAARTAATGWVPLTGDTWLEAEDDVEPARRLTSPVALRGEPGMAPIDHLYALLMAGLVARLPRVGRPGGRPPAPARGHAAPRVRRAPSPVRPACWTPRTLGGRRSRGGRRCSAPAASSAAAWASASRPPPRSSRRRRGRRPRGGDRPRIPRALPARDAGRRVVAPRQRSPARLHGRRGPRRAPAQGIARLPRVAARAPARRSRVTAETAAGDRRRRRPCSTGRSPSAR